MVSKKPPNRSKTKINSSPTGTSGWKSTNTCPASKETPNWTTKTTSPTSTDTFTTRSKIDKFLAGKTTKVLQNTFKTTQRKLIYMNTRYGNNWNPCLCSFPRLNKCEPTLKTNKTSTFPMSRTSFKILEVSCRKWKLRIPNSRKIWTKASWRWRR